jgi:hypothetical protein
MQKRRLELARLELNEAIHNRQLQICMMSSFRVVSAFGQIWVYVNHYKYRSGAKY